MIESLSIRHFQSLHDVTLELSPLTVVVGPSSSGKSALTRALRVLIENQRGASFISHGERIASITAKTDKGSVTLTRGKATNDNSYVVVPSSPEHPLAPRAEYTKLGGETPKEVSDFLGIDPKDPIAFASQFDKPFLLDERPAEIARVLGELTNVRVIFDAARESNRQKLAASATRKTRVEDLEAVKAQIPGIRALKTKEAEVVEAEHALRRARIVSNELTALGRAVDSLEVNSARLKALLPATQIEIPNESSVVEAYERLLAFRKAVAELVRAQQAKDAAHATLEEDSERLAAAEAELGSMRSQISGSLAAYLRESAGDEMFEDADGTTFIELDAAAELAQRWIEDRS